MINIKKSLFSIILSAFIIGCGGGSGSSNGNTAQINLTNKVTLSDDIATGSNYIDSNSNLYLGLKNNEIDVYKFLNDGNLSFTTSITVVNGIDRYTHIKVQNNELYVIGDNNGINIYDISNITSPQLLIHNNNYYNKSDSWSNPQEKFIVKDNYIMGTFNNKFMTLEINDSDIISDYSYGSDYDDYEQISVGSDVNNSFLFNQDSNGLNIFDINDPKSPVKLSSILNIHFKKYTVLNNEFLIGITNEGVGNPDKIEVINISDKNNPFVENTLINTHGNGSFSDYFIDNGYMYVLSNYASIDYLDIYDINDLQNIKLLKSYEIKGYNTPPVRIFEHNNYIYLFGADNNIFYFKKPF
ncbi:hypothetical protein [Caminibacter pacificus]|jgi:hypothetical protein